MTFFRAFVFVSLFCTAVQVHAADLMDEHRGYVGAQLGAGFSNNQGGTGFTFGGTAGYQILPNLVGAVFVNYMNLGTIKSPALSINGSSNSVIYYGLEGNYALSNILQNFYIGAKIGLASASVSASLPGTFVGDVSTTQFIVGPKVSYDFIFPSVPFSVGAELNFLFKTTSTEPAAGFSTAYGVSTIFNILGVAKFWF